ncbi:somatoliberin [Sarcophilus harrisii]|uniref:somatoliberin n=1 Tax=Sarcophilus harrisii TaxID=9305 RepID=UPI001301A746|nr:somatoliberin [Sarcophilus harrisii]
MLTRVGLLMVLHLITCSHCSPLYPALRYHPLPASGKEMSFQLRGSSPVQGHNLPVEEQEEGVLMDSAEKRMQRHADAIFTNSYRKVLAQISARKLLQTVMGKRLSRRGSGEEEGREALSRRQLDSILMDSCYHSQRVLQNFLAAAMQSQRPKGITSKLENIPGILTRLINL